MRSDLHFAVSEPYQGAETDVNAVP